ncbi:hypothetical protein [Haladaptatus sp. NG-WS-4]
MGTTDQDDSLLRIFLVVLAVLLFVPILLMAFSVPMGGWMTGAGFRGQVAAWRWVMLLVPLLVVVGFGYLAYRVLWGRWRRE